MIAATAVDHYIRTVQSEPSTEDRHKVFMRFICDALQAVNLKLPKVASDACKVARSYWIEGIGSPADLDASRAQCWTFLDELGASTLLTSPTVIAVRATICALYPAATADDFDEELVRWFVMLLDKLGDHSSSVNPLLSRSD